MYSTFRGKEASVQGNWPAPALLKNLKGVRLLLSVAVACANCPGSAPAGLSSARLGPSLKAGKRESRPGRICGDSTAILSAGDRSVRRALNLCVSVLHSTGGYGR